MADKKIAEFIRSAGITLRAERTDHNSSMADSRDMDHWRVTLRAGRSRMTLTFSKGYGHNGAEPTTAEVLDCLASDAATWENAQTFEDWCSEFGFDTDSRKAERIFKTVERQAARLKALLGESAYDTLLWHTERE